MKKSFILRAAAAATALLLTFSAAGCGTRTEVLSEWVEGEGTTTIVNKNNGGTQGTTSVNQWGMGDADSVDKIENSQTANASFDLKGAEIVIASWGSDDGGTPKPTDSNYQDMMNLISDIEKKYNCKIKFKGIADSMGYQSAWTAAAQSGVKFADIVTMATSWVWPTHMNSGYLTQLDDYINTEDLIFNQNVTEAMAINGKHYAVTLANRWYVGGGMFYNKAILSKFGVKQTPDKLVSSNKWNWDSFLEIAKKCNGELNGTRYYGYVGTGFSTWAEANGGKAVQTVNNKKVYDPDANYIKGVQFAYDLYNTHGFTANTSEWEAGTAAFMISGSYKAQEYGEILGTSNVGFTYIPMGPDVKDYNCVTSETTCFAIPSTTKNPAACAAILYDYIYPYKWRDTVEDSALSMFGDEASYNTYVDMAQRYRKNIQLSPLYTYITRTITWGDFGIKSQTSPQAYIASVKAAAQAELDTIWNQ